MGQITGHLRSSLASELAQTTITLPSLAFTTETLQNPTRISNHKILSLQLPCIAMRNIFYIMRSQTNTHTHTHRPTHTHTHTHTHPLIDTHVYTHTDTHVHTLTETHTRTYAHINTQIPITIYALPNLSPLSSSHSR